MTTQTVVLTGAFDGTSTLSPGLVAAATTQSASGSCCVGNKGATGQACVSPTGIPYTGALANFSGSGSIGCGTTAAGTETVTLQVQWFVGATQSDTSTIDVTVQMNGLAPPVFTAVVHGGQLDGATATAQFTSITPVGNCGSAAITAVNYAGNVSFLK